MSRLRYEDSIPLGWRRLASPLTEAELDRLQRENERLLLLLASLEPTAEPDEEGPLPRHLQLLELRLQLLTDLLAELLAQTLPLPPARSMWLSAERIGWQDEAPPAIGERVQIEVYLSEAVPRPVRLQAVVESVAGAEVSARLEPTGEGVADQLEKLIFRQHRRRIARERGGQS